MSNNIASGVTWVDYFPVRTSTGAPTTMTDGILRVLKDTATNVAGGITAGLTLATTTQTGLYQLKVDTSVASYTAGSDYTVVALGTVAGEAGVVAPVSKFSILNRPEALAAQTATATSVNTSYASLAATLASVSGAGFTTTDSLVSIKSSILAANPVAYTMGTVTWTTGTLTGGTVSDLATDNGVTTGTAGYVYGTPWTSAVDGFGLNVEVQTNITTSRVPSTLQVNARFNGTGTGRTVEAWGYDVETASWTQLSNSVNDYDVTTTNNASADITYLYPMAQNMVDPATGHVRIRFTSTSVTAGDVWRMDWVSLNTVQMASAGLTADAIQRAVWARLASGHDEATLGYNLGHSFIKSGDIVSASSASVFVIDFAIPADDIYNGMLIMLEDKTDGHYETRRIKDSATSTNTITVDRAFGFTPVAADDYYIIAGGYSEAILDQVNIDYASTALQISNSYASLVAQVATATSLTALQNSVNYSYASLILDHTAIKAQMAPATTLASVFTDTTTLRATTALATSLASAQTDITWMRANLAPATTLASVFTDTTALLARTASATSVNTSYASLAASMATLSAIVATNTDVDALTVLVSALPTSASGLSTTQDAILQAIPTTTAFNARTLPSAQYATNTDLDALTLSVSAIPTTVGALSTTQDATLAAILVDTGTTLDGLIRALPTTTGVVVLTSTDITNIAVQTSAAVIAGMGAATVTISSPVKSTGEIEIIRGCDYVTELVWALTYSGSLTGYTAALNCVPLGITAKAVTIAGSAGAYTITAAFTKAQTTALLVGTSGYGIKFTKTSDSTVLPIAIEGQCKVRDLLGT